MCLSISVRRKVLWNAVWARSLHCCLACLLICLILVMILFFTCLSLSTQRRPLYMTRRGRQMMINERECCCRRMLLAWLAHSFSRSSVQVECVSFSVRSYVFVPDDFYLLSSYLSYILLASAAVLLCDFILKSTVHFNNSPVAPECTSEGELYSCCWCRILVLVVKEGKVGESELKIELLQHQRE